MIWIHIRTLVTFIQPGVNVSSIHPSWECVCLLDLMWLLDRKIPLKQLNKSDKLITNVKHYPQRFAYSIQDFQWMQQGVFVDGFLTAFAHQHSAIIPHNLEQRSSSDGSLRDCESTACFKSSHKVWIAVRFGLWLRDTNIVVKLEL